MNKYKYSEHEINMFLDIGYREDELKNMMKMNSPKDVYSMAATRCIINGLTGPAVNSLRRCLKAWTNGVYRNTPEWDLLINLEK